MNALTEGETKRRARRPRYRLRVEDDPSGPPFRTGFLASGEQAVTGVYKDPMFGVEPESLCLVFTAAGELTEVRRRPLSAAGGPGSDETRPADRWLSEALAWRREMGWRAGAVEVAPFMLPDHVVYISDDPEWAVRYRISLPTGRREREEAMERLRAWDESGGYAFWWGESFLVSKDGEVHST